MSTPSESAVSESALSAPAALPAAPVSAFAPLRERPFALYLAGQLLSQIGDGLYLVALPFIVFNGGGSAAMLGVVLAAYGAARLALFPFGGMLADRWGARRLMLVTDVLRAVVVLGFVALAAAPAVALWALIAVAVPLGMLDGLFLPASLAVLPSLVRTEALAASNGLNSAMQSIALVVGPAIGGALVAAVHTDTALWIDALTFVASSVTLLLARPASGPVAEAPGQADGPAVTWRTVGGFLARSAVVKMALLITFVVNLAYAGMIEVALPSFAISPLGAGAAGFGVIVSGYGVGAAVGALLSARFARLPKGGLLALSLGVLQGVVVLAAPLGSSLLVVIVAMFVAAVLQSICSVFFLTALQREVPGEMLGRVMSLLAAAAGGAYPISAVLAGAVAGAGGPATVITVAGIVIAASFAIGFVSSRFRDL